MHSQVESMKKWLEELDQREQVWREQQRDKERRVKEEFTRRIAQIEEDFAEAVRNLELKFSAKKKALLGLYSEKDGRGKTAEVAAPVSCNESTKTIVCINTPDVNTVVSTECVVNNQTNLLPGNLTGSQNSVTVTKPVTRAVLHKVSAENSRIRRWQHRTFFDANSSIFKQKKGPGCVYQYNVDCDETFEYNGIDEVADPKQWPESYRMELFVFDPGRYTQIAFISPHVELQTDTKPIVESGY